MDDSSHERQNNKWEMKDLLHACSGEFVPPYIDELVRDVQTWLYQAVFGEINTRSDDAGAFYDRQLQVDLEHFFNSIDWVNAYADVIPSMRELQGREDAVIFSLGPIIQDEAFRMMIDHAALFGRGTCKRVWLISDTWVIGDVVAYMPHLQALNNQGVTIHFVLVTPWGWTTIPWNETSEPGNMLTWKRDSEQNSTDPSSADAEHCPPQTEV